MPSANYDRGAGVPACVPCEFRRRVGIGDALLHDRYPYFARTKTTRLIPGEKVIVPALASYSPSSVLSKSLVFILSFEPASSLFVLRSLRFLREAFHRACLIGLVGFDCSSTIWFSMCRLSLSKTDVYIVYPSTGRGFR